MVKEAARTGLLPEDFLDRLPGIGPRRREELHRLGVETILDLLFHLPSKFEDRRSWSSLEQLPAPGCRVLVRGRIVGARFRRTRRRGLGLVTARIEEGSSELLVLWFNMRSIPRQLSQEGEVGLFGLLREGPEEEIQLVNPEIVDLSKTADAPGLVPLYRGLGTLKGLRLRKIMGAACEAISGIKDPLSQEDLQEEALISLPEALSGLHSPGQDADIPELEEARSPAHRRLFFDQALVHFLLMEELRRKRGDLSAPSISIGAERERDHRALLPFDLTGAQDRVLGEILRDMKASAPMARLLQGDVGSGKTALAALAMAAAAEAGFQAVLMAPTEILAEQHARVLREIFAGSPWKLTLLRGSLGAAEGRKAREAIREGDACLIVGTHALIQARVEFQRLALAIVDEQHRFGTLQRRELVLKGKAPHLLVMTATPIPRSLALSLYGDLDLSLLDEKPAGRRPIRTEIRGEGARPAIYAFLRKEVEEGGRVYIVYPLIEESEHLDLPALLEHAAAVRSALPGINVGILHGRMSPEDKERVQASFRLGELQVLLATTVIEVGVDVPEASVMMIEAAQRFGLSQLHQLRGRVGRGSRKSWCIVMRPGKISHAARSRLEIFASTDDGFTLAEEDLKIRGPGELTGTRQWGSALPFDPEKNWDLVLRARALAGRLVQTGRAAVARRLLSRIYRKGYDGPVWRGMTG